VLFERGAVHDLGTLGGNSSSASGINDRGQIVGFSTTASGDFHAFLYENGVMTDLGTLPGSNFSVANGINNRGDVVGASGGHAVLWIPQ
jgi:probable HAF family extracellular repeat protein